MNCLASADAGETNGDSHLKIVLACCQGMLVITDGKLNRGSVAPGALCGL